MKMIKGTEEQEKIWNELENGDSHVMVYPVQEPERRLLSYKAQKNKRKKMGFSPLTRQL